MTGRNRSKKKKKKKKEKKKKTENLQSKGTLEKYEPFFIWVLKEIYWDNKRNPKNSENSDVV